MIVLVIRGLLSLWLSSWDKDFAARLQQRHIRNYTLTDHGWGVAWFSNVNRMFGWCVDAHKHGEKIILVGHSFGGTSVIMLTQSLAAKGIAVDFAGPIDPAYQYDTAMPNNVKRGVSFYQRTPGQLGQGIVHPDHTWGKGEWDKVFDVHKRGGTHLQVASDPEVQETLANEVKKCLSS